MVWPMQTFTNNNADLLQAQAAQQSLTSIVMQIALC